MIRLFLSGFHIYKNPASLIRAAALITEEQPTQCARDWKPAAITSSAEVPAEDSSLWHREEGGSTYKAVC